MDPLEKVILSLKKEEIRNFKIFSSRFKRLEESKIALLFDLLKEGKSKNNESEIVGKLFDPADKGSLNAYYRLKNRLKSELEKSLLNLHHTLDDKVVIMNYLTLSSIFRYKSDYSIAYYYLTKAEKLASTHEFYDLLDLIYNQIIALGHNFNDINPIVYLQRLEENEHRKQAIADANKAIAVISYKLRRSNFGTSEENVSITLQNILNDLKMTEGSFASPLLKLKIYQVVRDILLQNKEFVRLQSYLVQTHHEFEEGDIFTKANHSQKIKMITWIVNVACINKQWTEALHYTKLLHEELLRYNKLHYDAFIWTYYQALITNYMGSNRVPEALELLEQIKELPAHAGVLFYDYAIYVNLALCYYYQGDTSQSIKALTRLLSKDVYPKLEVEVQFSLSILEIVLHYENGNHDYVAYKLADLKRQFRIYLKRADAVEDRIFIKFMSHLGTRADPLHEPRFILKVKEYMAQEHHVQVGSNRHIDYRLWLQAKITRKPYYECLLVSLQS